jgi:hypothetical protein
MFEHSRSLLGLVVLANVTLAEGSAGAQGELATTPLAADDLTAGEEASVDRADQILEVALILSVDLGEGSSDGGLLADGITETSLVLDDRVRDLLGAAQGGDPQDELDGLDVASNDDELGLLLLDGAGDLLETSDHRHGGLGGDGLLGVLLLLLGNLVKAGLALLAGLRGVLLHELEELVAAGAVEDLGELVDGRGDLQAALQHTLLALHRHERGPAHEAGQVTCVWHILANTEVLGAGLERGRHGGLLGGGLSSLLVRGGSLGGGLRGLLNFLSGHDARLRSQKKVGNNKREHDRESTSTITQQAHQTYNDTILGFD